MIFLYIYISIYISSLLKWKRKNKLEVADFSYLLSFRLLLAALLSLLNAVGNFFLFSFLCSSNSSTMALISCSAK